MKSTKKIRTFSEIRKLRSFEERFEYAKIGGIVGKATFGGHRYLNQILYSSKAWKDARRECILRDDGNDLGLYGWKIFGQIYIHHLNPITIDDILKERDCVFDPEYLISTSLETHNALHYGDISYREIKPIIRTKNDTCPWKN